MKFQRVRIKVCKPFVIYLLYFMFGHKLEIVVVLGLYTLLVITV